MTQSKDAAAAVDEGSGATASGGPFASVVGTVVGGVLGLVLLVLVVSLMERTPTGPVQELPHAVVMVDFSSGGYSLESSQVRQMLVNLQQRLRDAGLEVSGPADYAILVPGQQLDPCKVRTLAAITDDEVKQARPYVSAGGWLVPRIYSADLTQAVIRIGPPGQGGFPPGTAAAIKRAVEAAGSDSPGSQFWIYSRALGLEDDQAKNRINITFGVQTAPVHVRSLEGKLRTAAPYVPVYQALRELRDPRLRSTATLGSWVVYAGAVMSRVPNKDDVDPGAWGPAMALAREAKLPRFVFDAEGKQGVVDVTTEAEGPANLEIANLVASHAQSDGFNAYVARARKN